jgi:hypothetical protein
MRLIGAPLRQMIAIMAGHLATLFPTTRKSCAAAKRGCCHPASAMTRPFSLSKFFDNPQVSRIADTTSGHFSVFETFLIFMVRAQGMVFRYGPYDDASSLPLSRKRPPCIMPKSEN